VAEPAVAADDAQPAVAETEAAAAAAPAVPAPASEPAAAPAPGAPAPAVAARAEKPASVQKAAPSRRTARPKPKRRRADVLAGTPSFAAPAPVLDPDAAPAEAKPEDATGATDGASDTPPASHERVAVRPGDTLSHLAVEHYGYTSSKLIDEIRRANPSVDERLLRPGQEILLPRADGEQLLEHLPGPGGETP
jgi:hypothetical protein